jgi:hypothetical protein
MMPGGVIVGYVSDLFGGKRATVIAIFMVRRYRASRAQKRAQKKRAQKRAKRAQKRPSGGGAPTTASEAIAKKN